ncbi:uncharacterized protein LOC127812274 isoform X1 [Diospyros lotus]|uniref:uncharacterized protein LOC127812274 isoform X1 n=1 Tax=Diospyros lotus TaxID=55363 RepID=UPI00224CDA53|nr:uncharacterized protein LOC127812274 isoform X1 [Diospyros lotus]
MGMWEFISATTETVKRNAPDLSSVKGACRSSYNFAWTAVGKADRAVRDNVVVNRVNHHLANDEDRAKIGRLAKNAAFYGFQEGIKYIPGGTPIVNILSRSLQDEKKKKTEDNKQAIEALQARITKLEKESGGKLPDGVETVSRGHGKEDSRAGQYSNANQKPEDAIRIFMMKEFSGRHITGKIFDDLFVPGVGRQRNEK